MASWADSTSVSGRPRALSQEVEGTSPARSADSSATTLVLGDHLTTFPTKPCPSTLSTERLSRSPDRPPSGNPKTACQDKSLGEHLANDPKHLARESLWQQVSIPKAPQQLLHMHRSNPMTPPPSLGEAGSCTPTTPRPSVHRSPAMKRQRSSPEASSTGLTPDMQRLSLATPDRARARVSLCSTPEARQADYGQPTPPKVTKRLKLTKSWLEAHNQQMESTDK